jgi:hypothetical protein
VIHCTQPAAPEPLRQLVGINMIALIPLPGLAPPIAHDHPIHQGDQQIVHPLRLGPFLKRDVNRPAHAARAITRPLSSRTDATVVA